MASAHTSLLVHSRQSSGCLATYTFWRRSSWRRLDDMHFFSCFYSTHRCGISLSQTESEKRSCMFYCLVICRLKVLFFCRQKSLIRAAINLAMESVGMIPCPLTSPHTITEKLIEEVVIVASASSRNFSPM